MISGACPMKDNRKSSSVIKKSVQYTVSAVIWLAVWFVVAKKINLEVVFPSLTSVLYSLGELLRTSDFYMSCLFSLLKILAGWLAGCLAGAVAGIMIFSNSWLDALVSPVVHIVKATPVASFIILALVLMKNSFVPSFVSALIVIPVICGNVSEGLKSPGDKLLEMSSVFGMSRKNKIKYIYIPAVSPYFIASARTAMGLAWKAGIAAEVICVPAKSIGKAIYDSKVYLDTPALFAWTAAVIVLSVIFEQTLKYAGKLADRRRQADES